MPDSHIWFEWQVSRTGYCWWESWERRPESTILGYVRSNQRQELIEGDRYLVVNADLEQTPAMDASSPLDATGLFREFAALEPSDDAIREFANRHGQLTDGELVISCNEKGDEDDDIRGEPVSIWIVEIARMSFVFQLWQLVQNSDKRGLERYIQWTDLYGRRGFTFDDRRGIFAPRTIFDVRWLPQVLRQRDHLLAARFMLDTLVTEQLSGQIDTRLMRDARQRPSLRYVPRDLRTAMWLQFARAIEGDKEYQQCDQCRMWFEIGSREGARSDKRFCSTACRARNWRQMKTRADSEGRKPA